jgi:hypothetical protein
MMELYLHSPIAQGQLMYKHACISRPWVFCDMTLKMEAAGFFETLHLSTRLCGVTKGWSSNNECCVGLYFGGACFESQLGQWLC